MAFVKKSFADGAALIKEKGDSGMSELSLDPFASNPTSPHVGSSVGIHRAFWRALRPVGRLLSSRRPGAARIPSKEVGTGLDL